MKKKTIFGGIIIVVLLACNTFLLYTNSGRQQQINSLSAQEAASQNVPPSKVVIGSEVLSKNAKVIHPEVVLPNSGLSLLVFFTVRSCPSCLEYEVPNLNRFYNKFPQHAKAFLITGGQPFLEEYGAEFSSKIISPVDSVFNINLEIANPVGVVIDSRGMVQSIYLSEVGNKTKSDRFYERMDALFSSLN